MPPFLKGAILGFSIAAPVGPIGLLCIQQSLTRGRVAGLACGLGAATADAAYGSVAAFGLSAVSTYLLRVATPLQIVGGLFLVFLGATTIRQRPARQAVPVEASPRLFRLYLSTVGLTLANPATILSFIAAFAGLGLGLENRGVAAAASMVAGVFAGSALWWLLLSSTVGALGARLTSARMRWVNLAAGIFLIAFGIWEEIGILRR